jgi:mRNA interferase MazF
MVDLDPTRGHEQSSRRPCIVISHDDVAALQRFPVFVIVPVTGTLGLSDLYPVVPAYPRGLTKPSTVLVDQVRAIDKLRVRGQLAPIPREHLAKVDAALRRVLGL